MKQQKLLLISIFLSWIITSVTYSNNVQISNVTISGQNVQQHFSMINFDISWDNSWRTSTFESNRDACWVFFKIRKKTLTTWNHATINYVSGIAVADGHTQPAGSTINTASDGKGIFIFKAADGIGSNNFTGAQIRWNYGVDGLTDFDAVEICAYSIEMVYVPQASFTVGDGGTGSGSFKKGASANLPFSITSENPLNIGDNANELWGTSTTGSNTIGGVGVLAASFPKGFGTFYCMKYEISQEQYVEFLNKLTRQQQATNVQSGVASGVTSVTNRYVLSGTVGLAIRNGVRCDAVIPATTSITFYCDLNGNGSPNEPTDGQFIACNYLTNSQALAYADWSGLRPMTELEFEKACRGTTTPNPNEYAWGNVLITPATSFVNPGANNEIAGNAGANIAEGNQAGLQGPMRVGNFAQIATSRQAAGATYYGIMEMSGNLNERCVSVGLNQGRAFNGLHGDGNLTSSGTPNVLNWDPLGMGTRGGSFFDTEIFSRVSDRTYASFAQTAASLNYGFRCARTAP